MFESLTVQEREPRRIAQPMLSFAIHASLIALAIGQGSTAGRPAGTRGNDFILEPLVIPVVDAPGPGSKFEPDGVTPSPGPTCHCEFPIPGPLKLDDPAGGTESLPGIPVSKPIGHPGTSILAPGPGRLVGVYSEGDLSDPPVMVHFPEPAYPPALKAAGVEGVVQVTYVVDSLGRVEPGSITIVSTDHASMAESVRWALPGARFQPGKVRGTPVRSRVRQAIRFSLMSL